MIGAGAAQLTPGIGIVFAFILLAGVLFGTERVPNDMAAIAVAVLLAAFGRWTAVTPTEAISGFASPATITVLAMFILSEGIRRTGVVQRLGRRLVPFTRKSERRQMLATLALGGPAAGFVNNTPLVAVLIPLVVDLAKRHRASPSRFLMPLSFVTMMGGTLTVIGSSTIILASDLSARLLDHPFSMFEFTHLGAIVLAVGGIYLMTLGRRLVPERIAPEQDLTQKFRMREYLGRGRVRRDSPLVGETIAESQAGEAYDLDILLIARPGRTYLAPTTDQAIEAGDLLTVRADPVTLGAFAETGGLEMLPGEEVTDDALVDERHTLVEAVVAPESELRGESLVSSDFRHRHGGTVLAIHRGDRVVRDRVETWELGEGDSLLLLAPRDRLRILEAAPGLEMAARTPVEEWAAAGLETVEERSRRRRTPVALGILAAVVGIAAVGLLPIYITALAGVVAMVATGCLRTSEAYEAVSWNLIFLLAGILPLAIALDRTGAADYLAALVVAEASILSPVAVLGVFYLLTALLANVISNNATVVLMVPVAVEVAGRLQANPLAFVLAVMFAASTAFMTPVGYPTNLMVYAPGRYRFTDYVRVGGPLQLLLAIVTTGAIALFWGV